MGLVPAALLSMTGGNNCILCFCRYTFDYHPGEVYWCTADIGWITGHSYITYGPLANGATSVLV